MLILRLAVGYTAAIAASLVGLGFGALWAVGLL